MDSQASCGDVLLYIEDVFKCRVGRGVRDRVRSEGEARVFFFDINDRIGRLL